MKINKLFFSLVSLFFFSIIFYVAITYSQTPDYNSGDYVIQLNSGATITFPYKINFSNAELAVVKNLDRLTLEKLVQVARQLKEKNLQISAQANTNTQTASSTIYSNTQNNQTPYYNQQTGQYQSKPVTNTTNPSNPYLNPNNPSQQMTANSASNPYAGSPLAQSYADSYNKYGSDPNGGYDNSLKALTSEDMKDLPKLGSGGESCGSTGTNISMAGTTERLRFDILRLCKAFGKKIPGNNARRPQACSTGSQHGCGTAIDFESKLFGDRKQKALLIVAFISLGYNIGSYQRDFALHADHEESGRWKTWSNRSDDKNGSSIQYADEVRDALSLIGMGANSAGEFRNKYGSVAKTTMSAKAKAYLQSVYGSDADQFTPAK